MSARYKIELSLELLAPEPGVAGLDSGVAALRDRIVTMARDEVRAAGYVQVGVGYGARCLGPAPPGLKTA